MKRMRLLLFAAVMAFSIIVYATEGANAAEHVNPEIPRISAYEVRKLYDQGKLLLVNTQDADGIRKSMLIGAIAAPDGLIDGAPISIPDDMIVAFYCM